MWKRIVCFIAGFGPALSGRGDFYSGRFESITPDQKVAMINDFVARPI